MRDPEELFNVFRRLGAALDAATKATRGIDREEARLFYGHNLELHLDALSIGRKRTETIGGVQVLRTTLAAHYVELTAEPGPPHRCEDRLPCYTLDGKVLHNPNWDVVACQHRRWMRFERGEVDGHATERADLEAMLAVAQGMPEWLAQTGDALRLWLGPTAQEGEGAP